MSNNNWHELNKRYLIARINELNEILASYLANCNFCGDDDVDLNLEKSNNTYTNDSDKFINKNQNNVNNKHNNKTESQSLVESSVVDYYKTITSDKEGNKPKLEKADFKNSSKKYIYSNTTNTDKNFLPALEILSRIFGLGEFEKNMVLLCAAVELDSQTLNLCSIINKSVNNINNSSNITFALGFGIFNDNAHWSALLPTSPLRKYQIIKMTNIASNNSQLVDNPIFINEQILHFLVGLSYSETHSLAIVQDPSNIIRLETEKITKNNDLDYYSANVSKILNLLTTKSGNNNNDNNRETSNTENFVYNQNSFPIVVLSGRDEIDGLIIANEVCHKIGLGLKYLDIENIPTRHEEVLQLAQSWTRDSLLLGMGLFISKKISQENNQTQMIQFLKIFIENIPIPVFIYSSEKLDLHRTNVVTLNLNNPSKIEQLQIWRIFLESLYKIYKIKNNQQKEQIIKNLVNQFDFTSSEIDLICKRVCDHRLLNINDNRSLHESLWDMALEVSKPKVGNLGILISPFSSSITSTERLSLDDIVLPVHEKDLLKTILIHCQYRYKVYREWGFEDKSRKQGLGITVLFAGSSGTGKTMGAEILSNELNLNMLKIDLSQVVSKYIGETEKNLDKIFESASKGGAVLFFDECDAIFGKRTEIKDSHDRYANLEISFLLQRMESYNGLAILSTNMLNAIDKAFLRRIRFIVNFIFPDKELRLEIWKKTFPKNTPLEIGDMDFVTLSELKITGGNIRNICLNASFFAAHEDLPVNKGHIKKAIQIEFSKIGQTLTNTDFFI
jgi:AAA+ superfamily predicted ATPase